MVPWSDWCRHSPILDYAHVIMIWGTLKGCPRQKTLNKTSCWDDMVHPASGPALLTRALRISSFQKLWRRIQYAPHCVFNAGATTTRMINRLAWEKGLVFAQCGGCEVWHHIRDAAGLVKEYRFKDGEEVDPADFTTGPTEWQTSPREDLKIE